MAIEVASIASIDRFWSHVDKGDTADCWLWTGARDVAGYGRWNSAWAGTFLAHRIALLVSGWSIPDGYEVDHLCHNQAGHDCPLFHGGKCPHRACVNPSHLAVVTLRTNRLSRPRVPVRTVCSHGHDLDEVNAYVHPRGGLVCRVCVREAHHKHRDHRNAARRARLRLVESGGTEVAS